MSPNNQAPPARYQVVAYFHGDRNDEDPIIIGNFYTLTQANRAFMSIVNNTDEVFLYERLVIYDTETGEAERARNLLSSNNPGIGETDYF